MTQPGETDGYSVSDHVAAINRHAGAEIIDFVLANNGAVEPAVLQHYAEAGQQPVRIDKKETGKEGATVGEGENKAGLYDAGRTESCNIRYSGYPRSGCYRSWPRQLVY